MQVVRFFRLWRCCVVGCECVVCQDICCDVCTCVCVFVFLYLCVCIYPSMCNACVLTHMCPHSTSSQCECKHMQVCRKEITLSNEGSTPGEFSFSCDDPLVQIQPSEGSLRSGHSTTITVLFSPSSLLHWSSLFGLVRE